jgi:hypothetical protein
MELRAMRAAWLAIACAACSARGVEVVIHVPPNVAADEVDVYVGVDECNNCDTAVGWDNSGGKLPADRIFLTDIDAATVAESDGGGRYHVTLQSKRDEKVDRLIVVAFHGTTVVAARRLDGVIIPANNPQQWNVTLDPVSDIVGSMYTPPPANTWRLHAWPPTMTSLARCLVGESTLSGPLVREFYLRKDDPDCDDGMIMQECDDFWYMDPGSATISGANCAMNETWPTNNPSTCLLGGQGCSETKLSAGGCTAIAPEYCLPDGVCTAGCLASAALLTNCIQHQNTAAIGCTALVAGADVQCSGTYSTIVDLGALVSNTAVACGELQVAPTMPLPMVSFAQQPWVPQGTGAGSVTIQFPRDATSMCAYGVVMTFTPPVVTLPVYDALLDVSLTNGRHDVIPVEIATKIGCPTPGVALLSCNFQPSGGDHVTNCATAP